mgnify:CR=1 FL=1
MPNAPTLRAQVRDFVDTVLLPLEHRYLNQPWAAVLPALEAARVEARSALNALAARHFDTARETVERFHGAWRDAVRTSPPLAGRTLTGLATAPLAPEPTTTTSQSRINGPR